MPGRPFAPLPAIAAWRLTGAHEGFEIARFRSEPDRITLMGTTVGIEDGAAWDLRYTIALDTSWRVQLAVIERGDGRRLEIARDGAGHWILDGALLSALDGDLDLDLEGSVVTNTIPVHRLALGVGEHAAAPAAYVRATTLTLERLDQMYARLGDEDGLLVFDYASPRFGYHDRLRFAPDGLVVDYPNIGSRVSLVNAQ